MNPISNKGFSPSKKLLKILRARLFSIMIIPYNKKADSRQFHASLLVATIALSFVGVFLIWLVYTSKQYTYLTIDISKLEKENIAKRQNIKEIESALRQYAINFAAKEIHIHNHSDLLGVNNKKVAGGKGGFGEPLTGSKTLIENYYKDLRLKESQKVSQAKTLLEQLDLKTDTFSTSRKNVSRLNSEFESKQQNLLGLPIQWPLIHGMGESVGDLRKNVLAIKAIPGSPVIATGEGEVVEVEKDPNTGIARITLSHPLGFFTTYEGLRSTSVAEGDKVERSAIIGSSTQRLTYQIEVLGNSIETKRFAIFRL